MCRPARMPTISRRQAQTTGTRLSKHVTSEMNKSSGRANGSWREQESTQQRQPTTLAAQAVEEEIAVVLPAKAAMTLQGATFLVRFSSACGPCCVRCVCKLSENAVTRRARSPLFHPHPSCNGRAHDFSLMMLRSLHIDPLSAAEGERSSVRKCRFQEHQLS
jgi:hypothetical protein